eukprot:TRINITY_DN5161_c0_g1_i1.p1 TRINITY_DN5161_c0_g1~~TRINITY_DN5161_c0_g1_i1.p1  ORF type:complete len:483 (+),score=127.32 TRINITY_DN5161_c0_g1_i1:206-1450(+)
MTVTWVTLDSFAETQSIVEFGTAPQKYTNKIQGESNLFVDPGSFRTYLIHWATFTDLVANTVYYYRVGDPSISNGWSQEFNFKALDASPQALKLAVYGDWGLANGANGTHSLYRLLNDTQKGMYDMIIHVGDYAYDLQDDEARVGDQFLNDIQPLAAHLPYQTCPGNHEADVAHTFLNYKQRFTMPGNSENMYFSFDVGLVHFISMSTEYYFPGPEELFVGEQYSWLKQDLQKATVNRAKTPWIIMYGHRPMYCSDIDKKREFLDCTSDTAAVREGIDILGERFFGIEQLLWDFGVDMYISGHEHSYERLWPVYSGDVHNGSASDPYKNPGAPVHIISGSAGCQEDLEHFHGPLGPWSAMRSSTYGYGRMTVYNATTLHWEQVWDQDGSILDELWLVKDTHKPFSSSVDDDVTN